MTRADRQRLAALLPQAEAALRARFRPSDATLLVVEALRAILVAAEARAEAAERARAALAEKKQAEADLIRTYRGKVPPDSRNWVGVVERNIASAGHKVPAEGQLRKVRAQLVVEHAHLRQMAGYNLSSTHAST